MSEEDVALERERSLFLDGKIARKCVQCGIETFRDYCPLCGTEELGILRTGDDLVDELWERRLKGEKVKLEDYFKKE